MVHTKLALNTAQQRMQNQMIILTGNLPFNFITFD